MPSEGINPIPYPIVAERAWRWFIRLDRKRPPALSGLCPIPESEIAWFFRNRGIRPALWELDAIERLDQLVCSAKKE